MKIDYETIASMVELIRDKAAMEGAEIFSADELLEYLAMNEAGYILIETDEC